MGLLRYPLAYVVTAVVFAVMDFGWLSWAKDQLYTPEIGPLLIDGVRLPPAIAFYLLYILGVTGLCVLPGLSERSWLRGAGSGALLGLAAYAAYDLTNQATMKLWSTKVTILDLAWGTFATAAASGLSVLILGAVLRNRS
jgi:uncharacterized membrane protein